MPVHTSPATWINLVGGTQTAAVVTTTPTDISLTSCSITMATSYLSKLRVASAWLELRSRLGTSAVGSNAFGNCNLQMSPDAGGNWYTGIALNGYGTVPSALPAASATLDVISPTDLVTYVQTAISTGTDITFKITGAVAVQNNLLLDDIIVVLHLICV